MDGKDNKVKDKDKQSASTIAADDEAPKPKFGHLHVLFRDFTVRSATPCDVVSCCA
jgi:hypothetical protein